MKYQGRSVVDLYRTSLAEQRHLLRENHPGFGFTQRRALLPHQYFLPRSFGYYRVYAQRQGGYSLALSSTNGVGAQRRSGGHCRQYYIRFVRKWLGGFITLKKEREAAAFSQHVAVHIKN